MWPILLGCISFVYSGKISSTCLIGSPLTSTSGFTVFAFYKRRIQFAQILSSSGSTAMNSGRYLRLMILASHEMMCTVPISIYSIYIDNKGVPLQPYISWANVHFGFSYVGQIPALQWRADSAFRNSVELTRWLFPVCALLFFALFGLTGEAQRHYIAAFWRVAKCFGILPPPSKTSLPASSRYVSMLLFCLLPYLRVSRPRWQFSPKLNPLASSVGSLPIYTSSRAKESTLRPSSILSSSSFAGTEMDMGYDVEKSAGLSSPTSPTTPSTPGQATRNEHISSDNLLVSPDRSRHISISDAYPCSVPPTPQPQSVPTPKPEPEETSDRELEREPVVEAYQRPFTSSNVYPAASPFFPPPPRRAPRRVRSGPIQVMIHTTELRQSD